MTKTSSDPEKQGEKVSMALLDTWLYELKCEVKALAGQLETANAKIATLTAQLAARQPAGGVTAASIVAQLRQLTLPCSVLLLEMPSK